LEGLQKLANLEELYISHNLIAKIEKLENPKLGTLDIGNNGLEVLEGLESLENLEELWVNRLIILINRLLETSFLHLNKSSNSWQTRRSCRPFILRGTLFRLKVDQSIESS
jgi:protein phosphatase 1 regulatory subunit 7